jgi:hypothetical protein
MRIVGTGQQPQIRPELAILQQIPQMLKHHQMQQISQKHQ